MSFSRKRLWSVVFSCFLFVLFGTPLLPQSVFAAQGAGPVFFGIQPGITTKAEVDLTLGEPIGKSQPGSNLYEYAPPGGATEAARVVVAVFFDTKQVSRVEVHLRAPIPAAALREQFGTRLMVKEMAAGGSEEIYYPKLQGIIISEKTADTAAAISFLSPRLLADVYVDRFNEQLQAKAYEEAMNSADKAVLIAPDYARGYTAQGLVFYFQKKFDEAIVRLLAATQAKHSPSHKARAHAWLADIYWHEGNKPDRAVEEIVKAIAIFPENDSAHEFYGQILVRKKQPDLAIQEFSKAVELNSQNWVARKELATLFYDQKQYEKAWPHYEALSAWVESQPASRYDDSAKSSIYFRYAYSLASSGKGDREAEKERYEKVIAAYKKSLEKKPEAITYNNTGRQLQALKRYQEAEEHYRKGLSLDPKYVIGNRNLGRLLLEMGRTEEALPQVERTLALEPNNAHHMLDVARGFAGMNETRKARQWIRKAAEAGYRDSALTLMADRYLGRIIQEDDDLQELLRQKAK